MKVVVTVAVVLSKKSIVGVHYLNPFTTSKATKPVKFVLRACDSLLLWA